MINVNIWEHILLFEEYVYVIGKHEWYFNLVFMSLWMFIEKHRLLCIAEGDACYFVFMLRNNIPSDKVILDFLWLEVKARNYVKACLFFCLQSRSIFRNFKNCDESCLLVHYPFLVTGRQKSTSSTCNKAHNPSCSKQIFSHCYVYNFPYQSSNFFPFPHNVCSTSTSTQKQSIQ